jgi:hypothetical protein
MDDGLACHSGDELDAERTQQVGRPRTRCDDRRSGLDDAVGRRDADAVVVLPPCLVPGACSRISAPCDRAERASASVVRSGRAMPPSA